MTPPTFHRLGCKNKDSFFIRILEDYEEKGKAPLLCLQQRDLFSIKELVFPKRRSLSQPARRYTLAFWFDYQRGCFGYHGYRYDA